MSNVFLLLGFKVKLFFSPSYRGRFGPLPLIALMVLFVPSGLGMGYAFGAYMDTLGVEQMTATLGAAFSGMLAFGFVFSLGVGITAQPTELDFLMTTPIKPREYLAADLLFQLTTIMLAGGVALIGALVGLIAGMGASIEQVVPLVLMMASYGLMVVFIIQSITIARIRYPNARVRQLTLLLIVLSIVAMLPAFGGSLGVEFADLPIPQAAYASLANSALLDTELDSTSIIVACAYFAAICVLWLKMSGMYFFYGVKPTLSGGFGQVDMGVKMAQQRRMIGFFGRLTDRISLRTETGGDLSLMTRLNLVRVWRDGSIVFIVFLVALFVGSGIWGSTGTEQDNSGFQINTLQAATWPIAIIALNWCYYERANLWISVVGGKSLVTYFKGLLASLVIIGILVSVATLGLIVLAGRELDMSSIAFTMLAPFGDSVVATILLTRIQVKPGAFSPGLLAILFLTFLGGALIAFGGSLVVAAVGGGSSFLVGAQLALIAGMAAVILYLGMQVVSSFSRTFHFQ